MSRVSRIDAFNEIARLIEENDFTRANEMLKILGDSIKKDKEDNTYSEYIELKNKREEMLFMRIIK